MRSISNVVENFLTNFSYTVSQSKYSLNAAKEAQCAVLTNEALITC